jgi:hypothetical protein
MRSTRSRRGFQERRQDLSTLRLGLGRKKEAAIFSHRPIWHDITVGMMIRANRRDDI